MRRYEVLDSWRGIAAVLVAFLHVPIVHALHDVAGFQHLQLFVDFFFVLSGFVICHAYGERLDGSGDLGRFVLRRFGRVWPLHAAVLGGFVLLETVKLVVFSGTGLSGNGQPFTDGRSVESIVTNLLMIQSFNIHGMTTWNGPAWSISTEFYTYLLFALVAALLPRRTMLYAGIAAAGAAVVATMPADWLYTTHEYGFARCVYGFFTGVVAYRLHRGGFGIGSGTVAEVGVLALLAAFLIVAAPGPVSLGAPLVFAAVILVFAGETGALSTMLRTPLPRLLGRWSYSIYMVHTLLFVGLRMGLDLFGRVTGSDALGARSGDTLWDFGGQAANWLATGLYLAGAILAAGITYALIEDPGRRLFNRIANRGRAASLPVTGDVAA